MVIMVKKFINRLLDWKIVYLQLSVIIIVFFCVLFFHGATWLSDLLDIGGTKESVETELYFVLVKLGDAAVAFATVLAILKVFRMINKETVLNSGNYYHDHLYIAYLICSKVLGYKKCCLIRVPVFMQFKLVVNDTFISYLYDEGVHEIDDKIDRVKVTKKKVKKNTSVVNLVIADTYPIEDEHLPIFARKLTTIKIDRSIKDDKTRYKSENLIKTTITEVRSLPNKVDTINLFGTLNSYHCYCIAKEVFAMGERSSIKHLVVYPQKVGEWGFLNRGVRIY